MTQLLKKENLCLSCINAFDLEGLGTYCMEHGLQEGYDTDRCADYVNPDNMIDVGEDDVHPDYDSECRDCKHYRDGGKDKDYCTIHGDTIYDCEPTDTCGDGEDNTDAADLDEEQDDTANE